MLGHDRSTRDVTFVLRHLSETGQYADLTSELRKITAEIHHTTARGNEMTETEKLLDEAYWYASRGDFDEAHLRIQQADNDVDWDEEDDGDDYE